MESPGPIPIQCLDLIQSDGALIDDQHGAIAICKVRIAGQVGPGFRGSGRPHAFHPADFGKHLRKYEVFDQCMTCLLYTSDAADDYLTV